MSYKDNYETTWVPCECHSHIISVSFWRDKDGGWEDDSAYLSVWGFAEHGDSFRWRLRAAWHALRGDLHMDQVVLDPEEATKLAAALTAGLLDA